MNQQEQITKIRNYVYNHDGVNVDEIQPTGVLLMAANHVADEVKDFLRLQGWTGTSHPYAKHHTHIFVYFEHAAPNSESSAYYELTKDAEPILMHIPSYAFRVRGQQFAFAVFVYITDAMVMFNHYKAKLQGLNTVYELIDLSTGKVIYATDDPK